jgi:hypothetical protein
VIQYLSGLLRDKGPPRWRIRFNYKGSQYHSASYVIEEEAARAHDKVALALLESPILNFLPPDGRLNPDRRRRIGWQSIR